MGGKTGKEKEKVFIFESGLIFKKLFLLCPSHFGFPVSLLLVVLPCFCLFCDLCLKGCFLKRELSTLHLVLVTC